MLAQILICHSVEDKQKEIRMMVKIYYLYFMITLSVFSITLTSFQAFSVEEIWEDYERLGEMVKDIRNGNKDDDKVDYNKFKDSAVYKNAEKDVRNCIDLANKVGEKLGDYEIVRCFENTNYFEEKYVDDEDGQNTEEVNRQDSDNQNMTRTDDVSDADRRDQEQEQEQQQQQERPTSDTSDTSASEDVTENNLINELVKTGKFTQDEAKEFVSQNMLSGANITSASNDVSANETQATHTEEQQQEQEQQQQQQQEQVDQNKTRLQIMANASQTESSEFDSNLTEGCNSSYPEICITTYSSKLICADIPYRNFKVILPDPHGFDSDADGIGCEE
jgi:polyhydroxyalkanoate synthesis regulator phasin